MKRKTDRGVTLFEALIVIALMGILTSLATLSMRQYQLTAKLKGAADRIGADIRCARASVFMTGEPYHIDFRPDENAYLISGLHRTALPQGIYFGTAPGVTGRPSDPYAAPPKDGITFRSDGGVKRATFLPKGLVVPTGAVYLTNGSDTTAVTVGLTGHTTIYWSQGGNKWIEM